LLNRWLIDEAPPELRRGDLGESEWRAGGKTKTAPLPFACDPPAAPRRTVTATGRNSSSWATSFASRPAGHFSSIFVDGFALFPQMDVWSRDAVDPIANGSQKQIVTATHYSK